MGTVRGFTRRSRVGMRSLRVGLQHQLPYDLFRLGKIPILRDARLQPVIWADAGRAWEGVTNSWIYSTGFGLQRYAGPFGGETYVRLDVALPLGPDRPDEVRFYVYFTRRLF